MIDRDWSRIPVVGVARLASYVKRKLESDPKLAMLLHAVVGGTPAYRREFVAFDVPSGLADFDSWVIRTVLNPQSPLFREARYLLA